jgi:hypothetical protein
VKDLAGASRPETPDEALPEELMSMWKIGRDASAGQGTTVPTDRPVKDDLFGL